MVHFFSEVTFAVFTSVVFTGLSNFGRLLLMYIYSNIFLYVSSQGYWYQMPSGQSFKVNLSDSGHNA